MNFQDWLASFKPGFDPVPFNEKLRSGLAALIGMLLLGMTLRWLPHAGDPLITLASMAAAAVLLYAVPHSPMAQPWPLVCGNLLSALVGWACSALIHDPVWAAACAVGLSIFAMHLANCLHPPGGATAMIMVAGAQSFHQHGAPWIVAVVVANTLLSLLLALGINHLVSGRRYPSQRATAPEPRQAAVAGIDPADIEWALTRMNGVIDVSEDDLLEIYQLAAEHARGSR
jgi:CBS domain-containing membrane protein